jgi:hypothetical protein
MSVSLSLFVLHILDALKSVEDSIRLKHILLDE